MDIQIKLFDDLPLLNEVLDNGLYQTVYECFSAPPFNENVIRENVEFYFQKYVRFGSLHLAYCQERAIGFMATLPLTETKEFRELSFLGTYADFQGKKVELNQEFFSQQTHYGIEEFQYVSDVGVALDYRKLGLAKRLLQSVFAYFDDSTPYILRTTCDPDFAYVVELYQKVGFTLLPVTQTMEYLNQEGVLTQRESCICVKLPSTSSRVSNSG
ncbi:MAG: GNAT family N-acetyltransferase [Roseofilum sp. SBFL]|uniref:GNAT family N-acetyltransferase n=1 Tax=unclassified Roseofilum TaxID=2620099 RepID=UPI001B26436A|nr:MULTISPECIES: GNAT family N-acetyltransferase [unclassified Roseofilum]MBP0015240.1 GNAT family N-acetyltransferase [Roseofilum sp. SID3]MBP0023604.1 GNAT family N-acetyltransferase [Roseofilum sp. SID2]MBP0039265.1 GNAT family N-acetyltransferase [Roseofilum sp. SID1]MBP0042727.1 GNAT family N-acetyltransferase [Roseofilum sp. SBFL]